MYGLWRLEDEAVRRYHRQCESLECREDALRVRERRLDQVAEGFLWDVGRCRAMVDDMLGTVPCVARQAAFAAEELACAQGEATMRLGECHGALARERRDLERQRDQADEEYRHALRSCHG